MKLKIHSCGIHDCLPSWNWVTHERGFSDYDIWAVFRGKGCITSQGPESAEYTVYEGAALLLAPNIQYIAWHDPQFPLLVINIHFDFLDDNGNVIYPSGIMAKTITDIPFFKMLLTRTVALFNSNQEDKACAFLNCILVEYAMSDELTAPESNRLWTNMVREMIAEIDASKKPPSLAEFADRYGYSERYVGKMFAKINKISFSEYILNARINKAKALLQNTSFPVSEVAEELGFYDACYFSRVFRAKVGVSPLAYRNIAGCG